MRRFRIIFWLIILFVISLALFLSIARGATNIDPVNYWAWGDVPGWIDFYNANTVNVRGDRIEGYASSSLGDVSLDCATTRIGNICATSNYGVCNGPGPHNAGGNCPSGDGSGNLTGWGWNDTLGWISFNCDQSSQGGANTCANSNYKAWVDTNGDLQGYAWNDLVGWISFNCNNGNCGTSNYKVTTLWQATSTYGYLESSVFDTSVTSGATLNSVIWQGTQPSGTSVDFQISASNSSSGPWSYFGPGGSNVDYYGAECPNAGTANPGAGPNKAICVDKNLTSNYRYLRYKVRLRSNLIGTLTPRINDIILNWSE